MDNVLPISMWAVVRPASKNYIHQPAYDIMHWSIRKTKSASIQAFMTMWDGPKWRRFKKRGYKCIHVNILSSQKASQLYMQELNVPKQTESADNET